ncbi:TetR/AcrR family transcriptional regulator [Rugosimonospora africana]|uniref:TetR family transcriptional regulator n=1 Tax=Rugosimonospora africana TaxID=556532 RepID=A0A8J3QMP0_9ACTN|nr:TetR/AcrR family transcriptional regulator [Rugosimonospora africana]GIH13754.1 TetR family transcriptional regulator [Rugosimonospora africana]
MGTRDTILDAALHVVRTRGLNNATTKEIARAAGFSEATLYKHFDDKEELFVEVLRARVPTIMPAMKALLDQAGQDTVRDNLLRVARAAADFYTESFPMFAATFSEPQLLARHREALAERNVGPHRAVEGLAEYLDKERALGRVSAGADAPSVAAMLLGACFQYAFLAHFAGREPDPADLTSFCESIVDSSVRAL